MPPTTSRDFLKVAAQQLMTAEVLLSQKLTLAVQYVGGYVVECSLKALILDLTPSLDRPDMLKKLTAGAKMQRPDILLNELRLKGVALPLAITKRMRRFDWSTELRYETGRRDTGETIALLTTAKLVYEWVKGQLP